MLPVTVLATAAPVYDPALAVAELPTAPYWGLWEEFIPLKGSQVIDENGMAATQSCCGGLGKKWRFSSQSSALLGGEHTESTYAATSIEKYNLPAPSTWHPNMH